ncbi:polysaccharide deacetylase family protein [Streptomyces violaceusniger]|uniref:Polysaccharide deacetylase n=1 Tax=Streptomyces violaceusniger (strain Tu 4113) TaxID=653045 RepID=G2PD55_STRV4|nr:polysaccharide deacetylase family protein [Streptomyces violaceusniger]AEM80714.1 polysaccharide deacetylase [Streptomyces violaceusniger Tu 4113]
MRASGPKITYVMMIKTGFPRCLVLVGAAAVLTACGSLGAATEPHTGSRHGAPMPPASLASRLDDPPSSSQPPSGREPERRPPALSGPVYEGYEGEARDGAFPDGPSGSGDASASASPPAAGPSGTGSALPHSAPMGASDAYRRWGLDRPLERPPAPPAVKPALGRSGPQQWGLPPIVRQVPTDQRVVFVTIDDGIEKDPRFVEQARELGLPFTGFLTDNVIGDHYDYFDRLRRLGNPMENHTLTHPSLAGMAYDDQVREICGQRDNLWDHFGQAPRLFRPPFGEYDETTLRAAGFCGARTVVLWRAEMETHGLAYRSGDHLLPGDIILAHFRGPEQLEGQSMTDWITGLVRAIQAQGFTIGRLEDYV